MIGLEQRLRNALDAEANLWPYPAETQLEGSRRQSRSSGWMITAATSAAILVVVAGAYWVFGVRSSETAQLGSETPAPLSAIAMGPFEMTAGGDGEFGVEPLTEEPDANGIIMATALIESAVSGPNGFVAVGELNGSDGGVGAVWYSSDGSRWQRVPHDDELFGSTADIPNTMIVDVAAGDAGFLAVGVHFSAERQQIVWASPDGVTWTRTEVPGFISSAVAATDTGWTVVGGGGLQGAVWNSTDGLEWEAAPSEPFLSDTHNISLQDVAFDGELLVTVGGTNATAVREERAAIWISDDGIEWTEVIDEQAAFDQPSVGGAVSVVSGPRGFVAMGRERLEEGGNPTLTVVWFSSDGKVWDRVVVSEDADIVPLEVVAGDAGYVIVGLRGDDSGVTPHFWTSTDGLVWDLTESEGLDPYYPGTALLVERRLLVLGAQPRETGNPFDTSGYGAGAVWEAGL